MYLYSNDDDKVSDWVYLILYHFFFSSQKHFDKVFDGKGSSFYAKLGWFCLYLSRSSTKLSIIHRLLSRGDTTSYLLRSASVILYGALHCNVSRNMISICIVLSQF